MSTFKTSVELGTLDTFFQEQAIPASNLEAIEDGEVSQAYLFETKGKQKVLRVNAHTIEGFEKDRLAHDNFAGSEVPIPVIEDLGQLPGGTFYAISKKVPGTTIDKLSDNEFRATLPSLIRTMDAIHQTKAIGSGFGWIKLDGNGKRSSWLEALDTMQVAEDDNLLSSVGFFESDIYNHARSKIKEYYKFCPKDISNLIHTDYGFNNTLAENGQVTGVIDWYGAAYGDPLYDVAWLDFWAPIFNWSIDIVSEIKQYYADQNRLPEHFEERIVCYKMIIAANSMSFFAKSDQKDKYDYARNELLKIDTPFK
jgi:hygromycin-B 4-O-kinase